MHGGDIYRNQVRYDFSVNLNPRGCPEGVLGALEEAIHHVTEYPDLHHQELRTLLAGWWNVSEQQIVLGNGASEIITAFVQAYQPKSCLLTAPTYTGYERVLRGLCPDCQCHYHPLQSEKNFTLGLEIVDEIRRLKPDMIILTNPNNPNGKLISPDVLDAVLTAAGETGTAVMIDECFMALTGQEEVHSLLREDRLRQNNSEMMMRHPHSDTGAKKAFSAALREISKESESEALSESLAEPLPADMREILSPKRMPNTLVLRAFTKTFAIPGVRLGYGVALAGTLQDSIANATRVNVSLPEWNLSVFAQKAGAACLACGSYLAESMPIIAEEREYLSSGLAKLGCEVFPSDTNYILFCSEDTDLSVKLLSKGILIRSCEDYHGLGAGYYRIAVLEHAKNQILLEALQSIVHKY